MQQSDTHMKNTGMLLIGAALGAGLAALFAPRSGRETRQHIIDKFHEGKEQIKQKTEEISEDAKDKLNELRDDIEVPDRLAKRNSLEEGLGE